MKKKRTFVGFLKIGDTVSTNAFGPHIWKGVVIAKDDKNAGTEIEAPDGRKLWLPNERGITKVEEK